MSRPNDITSTEKLLNVIRNKVDEAPTPHTPAAAGPSPKKPRRIKLSTPSSMLLRKPVTVGVDIGHDALRIVKAVESAGGKWQIIDWRRLELPPKTSRGTPEFAAFLKSSLSSVCGSAQKSNVWVIMSAARVDVHHVRIPKVARKQIENAVYWTAKKGNPFDEKEMVFDFELQGEVIEQGIPKLAAMVYTAPRDEIDDLKKLFSQIGWPLTGISVVPFAIQNLFRTEWIPSLEGTTTSLYIGNDFSRIDIYSGGNLVLTRGIKAGLGSMVEALVEQFNDQKTDPRTPPLTLEQGHKIIRSLSPDSPPLRETDAGFSLGKDAVFEMIQPALERLARQVERTFEHYATTMPGDRIDRIFVSCAMNSYQPIIDYVGSQLGIESALLDPLSGEEPDSYPDVDDLNCVSERIAFAPALGLALSANDHTPNLMFTYRDKEQEARVIRINRAVFAVFVVAVLGCSGLFAYQNHVINQNKITLAGFDAQLAQLGQPVDRNQLLEVAAKVNQRRELSKGYAERYLGMVIIGEITALTPANVRFLDLKVNPGPVKKEDAGKSSQGSPLVEGIVVEGLILGERQLFETSLASYIMALESSPLFNRVTIQKNDVESYLKSEALHFIVNLKVEEQVHG